MKELFYAGIRAYSRLGVGSESNWVFAIDDGASRSFIGFDSLDDFEPWYTGLRPSMRTLNEVIRSEVRKLVLDIDDPRDDRLLMYDFERHITSRIHDVFFELDIGIPEVLVYSMCSDYKISYHAVVSNFMFSAQSCFGLCALISSGQPWECCVDTGVYKKVQFIRLEMSTKFGEKRWKERLGNPGSLRQGILSSTEGAIRSEFVAQVSCKSNVVLLPTFNVMIPARVLRQFKVCRPKSNGVVPLHRVEPGMCPQCNRVHDKENAFIKPSLAGPVFVCWRYYYFHMHNP